MELSRSKVLLRGSFPSTRTYCGVGEESTNRREYLSVAQLAELVPWSEAAIRTLMARGKLQQGVHFFKPFGPGSHPIFKWSAVKEFIEGTKSCATPDGRISLANGAVVELGEDDA